jgi:hypothetical protein
VPSWHRNASLLAQTASMASNGGGSLYLWREAGPPAFAPGSDAQLIKNGPDRSGLGLVKSAGQGARSIIPCDERTIFVRLRMQRNGGMVLLRGRCQIRRERCFVKA